MDFSHWLSENPWAGLLVALAFIVVLSFVGALGFGLLFATVTLGQETLKRLSHLLFTMKGFRRRHIRKYLLRPAQSRAGAPYIRGKIVVIDERKKWFHDLMFRPALDAIRAREPAEAKTVAILSRSSSVVGSYEDGGDATRLDYWMTLVDREDRVIVDSRHFFGSEPPSITDLPGGACGYFPDLEVVDYLRALPCRK